VSWFWIAVAPLLGGLVYGGERVLRARMQRRMGPPLLQPFYDMFKLMEKRTLIVHAVHALLGAAHFFLLWLCVAALFLGWNLLYIIFLHLFALIVLVAAGYSVKSAYSQVGANRELLALVAYEPVLVLVAVGFYLSSGSFEIDAIVQGEGYLAQMPLLFVALLTIIPIKVKKSPFDVVEAHQEIVGGVEVEYSGIFYEFLYMARFMEYLFIYSFVYLFGGAAHWLGALLVGGAFLLVNLVDNATARVRTQDMLGIVYKVTMVLAVANIVWMLWAPSKTPNGFSVTGDLPIKAEVLRHSCSYVEGSPTRSGKSPVTPAGSDEMGQSSALALFLIGADQSEKVQARNLTPSHPSEIRGEFLEVPL